ncbi:bacteriohemerythrin [Baaleninema sp.]|uniref:bacteriohemerythrin n=1 Tax=Baaleninema sp. TaxID=3101197 RepID=UPI003D058074
MQNNIWNDSLKIGIPEIDQQHKQLIEQMGLLVEAMRENQAHSEIAQILKFLEKYIDRHFGFEEQCMESYRCPVACQNKEAHAKFIKNFQEIKTQFDREGSSLSLVLKVNQSLLDWFLNHIRKIDTQLARSMVCDIDKKPS